jgi:hypothetical protein
MLFGNSREPSTQTMRISRTQLYLKYVNRSPNLILAVFPFFIALMLSPMLLTPAAPPFLCLVLLALLGGIALVTHGLEEISRTVRLIEGGTATLGIIDQVEIRRGRGKSRGERYVYAIRYMFETTENGEPLLRMGERLNVPYLPGEVFEGEVVVVVYDPNDPSRSEIDGFDARQEDRFRLLKAAND